MRNEDDTQRRTMFCGNLSEKVTESILFELFNQAGPVESVRRPKDQNGQPKSFGFIVFKHECSLPYAIELFKGTRLYNRNLNLNCRENQLCHIPVLDTHLTEFTGPQENRNRRSRNQETEDRNGKDLRNEDSRRRHRSRYDSGHKRPSSWTEVKNDRRMEEQSSDQLQLGSMQLGNVTPEQIGLSLMLPLMGLGPHIGSNIFPSMLGNMNGDGPHFPSRDGGWSRTAHNDNRREPYVDRRRRNDSRDANLDREFRDPHVSSRDRRDSNGNHRREHTEGNSSRRNHPYDDRTQKHWADYKSQNKSSRSSVEGRRENRRSR